jgi:hypothetical protein
MFMSRRRVERQNDDIKAAINSTVLYSGMQGHIIRQKLADVSEGPISSNFSVEE